MTERSVSLPGALLFAYYADCSYEAQYITKQNENIDCVQARYVGCLLNAVLYLSQFS